MTVSVIMTAAAAFAFPMIPKDSAKALGVTKGKPFSSGAVFINGKYLEPPYLVERWGTGLRINSCPVSGQIVDWNEFVKTQAGAVKTVQPEEKPVVEKMAPEPAVAEDSASDENSLDDLFDDAPKPKKKKTVRKFVPRAQPVQRSAPTYSFSGEFVLNDSSRALLARVNSARTEIDRILRSGGFICFGESYPRVVGDQRSLLTLLEKLPELQQNATSTQSFCAGARAAQLIYLNEVLCMELFQNRVDYRKLRELREKLKKEQLWKKLMNGADAEPFG